MESEFGVVASRREVRHGGVAKEVPMGEYEDRYPESYGRGEDIGSPPPEQPWQSAVPQQVRVASPSISRFLSRSASGAAPAWRHTPDAPLPPSTPARADGPRTIEPTAPPLRVDGSYRGIGPRGYVRSPERIYEDVCDRLTDNPFIDASDIAVAVSGSEVTLTGSVDSPIVARQTAEIAEHVAGVRTVQNRLVVRR